MITAVVTAWILIVTPLKGWSAPPTFQQFATQESCMKVKTVIDKSVVFDTKLYVSTCVEVKVHNAQNH